MSALLAIDGLTVSFPAGRARARVIEDVGFAIGRGEIVALVGESGSGKSVTALATMRLLAPTARCESGAIRLLRFSSSVSRAFMSTFHGVMFRALLGYIFI